MTYNISTTQRLAPGETWTITDMIGINIVAPAPGQTVVSFSNAGTILINTDSIYITAGINYAHGSEHRGSVFTNEATGVFRMISTGGFNQTYGFTSQQAWTGFTGAFVNHGVFEVTATAFAAGIQTFTSNFNISNTGQFRVRGETGAIGVLAEYGMILNNSGLIEVTGPEAVGVSGGTRSEITNSGTIRAIMTGSGGWGVGISLSNSDLETSRVVNTGLIEAQYAILDQTAISPPVAAAQIIDNSGRSIGAIALARGDDLLTNTGSINGDIWLGYGADVYEGAGGSHVGILHAGFGDDVITGGQGAEALYGEDGDDVMRGGGGDDILQGGRGDNLIDGGDGIDTLTYQSLTIGVVLDLATGVATAAGQDEISGIENVYGSRWIDRIAGDVAANLLFGAEGDDVLDGRAGADTLVGGAGADTVTGGLGADLFRFGHGDGADVVTDLSPEDRVIVHGYTSHTGLTQTGSDVLMQLSGTDSILFRNSTVTAVIAQTTFTSAARPVYQSADTAPEMLGDIHVEILGRFEILEGESLSFDGAIGGLAVYGILEPGAGVTNAGLITSTGSNGNGAVGLGLAGFNFGGDFDNLASGVLRVSASHAGATAVGVVVTGWQTSITNDGLIDVRSAFSATGIDGQSFDMSIVNSGSLLVDSGGRARGANLGAAASLVNDGLIEVVGSGDVLGIHSYFYSNFVNHGTLRVVDRIGESVGIKFRSDVFDIVNTGLIEADIAIDVRGYGLEVLHGLLDNSGEIRGVVSLSGGDDQVTNTGLIDGEIRLNEGSDTYDGTAGRQTGAVLGGLGRDHLVGGQYADNFAGGDHSDTLVGGGGDDLLDGGDGDDFAIFSGPRSAYSWTVSGDTITITGPDGTDVLKGVELLRFADELVSLTGYGIRERGTGDDDEIRGSELNDVLDGGPVPYLWEIQGSTDNGRDRLFGLAGDDILTGGGKEDHLDGGAGIDQLDGGLQNDALYGGAGDDLLTGGKGSDVIDGGAGVDVAVFAGARADYVIQTANGVTTLTTIDWVNPYNPDTITMATDVLTGVERLQFSDQTIILRPDPTVGGDGVDIMTGGAGDDSLAGGAGADRLDGGGGDDELNGGLGDDLIDGGAGYDTLMVEGAMDEYRLLADGDGWILKGADGGDRLAGVEMIRFSQGGSIDLARMYAEDGPQVMPMPDDFVVKNVAAETLPPPPADVLPSPSAADFLLRADLGQAWRPEPQDLVWGLFGGLGPDAEQPRDWGWA